MNWVITILKLGNLIGTLVVPTIEDAMKIRRLFRLSPDFQTNVKRLTGEALDANQGTKDMISAWAKEHGLPEDEE